MPTISIIVALVMAEMKPVSLLIRPSERINPQRQRDLPSQSEAP